MKKNSLIIISILLSLIFTACSASRTTTCEDNCSCCNIENSTDSTTEKDGESEEETNEDIGVIKTESETYEKSEEEKNDEEVYMKAKELYLSGEWNGLDTTLDGHDISFSARSGNLDVDGHIVEQENLHMPDEFDYNSLDSNLEYVPGQGNYAVKDGMLVKFARKEMVTIGELDCEGLDTDSIEIDPTLYNYDEYCEFDFNSSPYLYYDKESDTLILVTCASTHDKGYLYIFPDYTSSQVKSLGTITNYTVLYDGKRDTFYYTDVNGYELAYTRN